MNVAEKYIISVMYIKHGLVYSILPSSCDFLSPLTSVQLQSHALLISLQRLKLHNLT